MCALGWRRTNSFLCLRGFKGRPLAGQEPAALPSFFATLLGVAACHKEARRKWKPKTQAFSGNTAGHATVPSHHILSQQRCSRPQTNLFASRIAWQGLKDP